MKPALVAIAMIVMGALGFLVCKIGMLSGDDAPIIVSGGSLHIMASPGSKGAANGKLDKHNFSLVLNGKELDHHTGNSQTNDRTVPQVEVSAVVNGKRQNTPIDTSASSTVVIQFGYCIVNSSNCDDSNPAVPKADDIVTATASNKSLTFTSLAGMDQDDPVFDGAWNHKPFDSQLKFVNVNGIASTCMPGTYECSVIIHFCKGSCS